MRLLAACAMLVAMPVPGQAADVPTHGGILRLTRGWRSCQNAALRGANDAARLSLASLRAVSASPLDLDRLPIAAERQRRSDSRVVWREFAAPVQWKGQPVWLTYDAVRMQRNGIRAVFLNGKRLPIGLPKPNEDGTVTGVLSLDEGAAQTKAPWFVDIGPRLVHGTPNVVAFLLSRWPPLRSAGVWIYSKPERERALFLLSPGLSPRAVGLIRTLASHIREHFAIEPLVVERSFVDAAAVRRYLQECHREQRISGVVLIGTHPMPRFMERNGHATGQPRYYEDLDATFTDSDGDGFPDRVESAANFGCEIWVSWIRVVPEHLGRFEPFLRKAADYYERKLRYPGRSVIVPKDVFETRMRSCGLDHIDLFQAPADLASAAAHGGTGHAVGPRLGLELQEPLGFYPGATVVQIGGCHAADMLRPSMTAAEAYLLGRSNAVLTFSNMQGEGGQNPSRHIGIREELARICPHFGPFYSYYLDLRGGASVGMQSYLDSGYAMAGNPFVNLGLDLSAPSGTISGRVVASRAGDPVAGFYVGAYRAGLSYGRVRTGPDGSYALRCLPPGEFDVRLNVNGMDGNTQRVTAAASATARADWKVGPLWRLSGQVLNERGEPGGNCWAEMAAGPGASDFVKTRDYGLRTSSRGLFEAWGEKPGDVWLIGRSGRQFDSPPLKVTIQPGETRQGISLRVASSTAPGPARSRSAEALMKAAASASAAVAPRPTYSPTADTRSVWVGVVPVTKQPPKRFARRPAYPHFLRIGLQVGADIPVPPVGNTETYSILIDTLGGHARPGEGAFPATHRIHLLFSRMAGHWTAKLAGRDARLDTTDASVAGARIFVDVYPLSGGPMVNWRFYASATVIGGGLKNAKFAPEKGWYRLNADLGPRPSVRLTEETPPQAVKRRRR